MVLIGVFCWMVFATAATVAIARLGGLVEDQ